jgi:3-deoxy-D-manno-octulosonate 8-phosphate phosphatase (KDO 8-P phosphatase)
MRRLDPTLRARLRKVVYFLCDVDGVLTDGSVLIGPAGEYKRFDIQDGLGLVQLRKNGIKVGWISSRTSPATTSRAGELKIDFLSQTPQKKLTVIESYLRLEDASWEQVCYTGDDLVDLGPLRRAGVGVAVANAVAEVKKAAHYVTTARGGSGAVREVAELVLKAQGRWGEVLQSYEA